jgi:DNA polymerase-3 subunit epsilon
MREIVLDTETTGLDPDAGDRIIEIGAVELVNHMPTGRVFHAYINPQREVPADAVEVHGLTATFLADKPVFAAIAAEFAAFIGDARLVIHNAAFDVKFLNAELGWCGHASIPWGRAVDTLELARRRFPGAQNTLDALCRRFGVDNTGREKHGALLDSELLAEVYLELMGGRQPDLVLSVVASGAVETGVWSPPARPRPLPPRLTSGEVAAHAAFVAELGPEAVWASMVYGDSVDLERVWKRYVE